MLQREVSACFCCLWGHKQRGEGYAELVEVCRQRPLRLCFNRPMIALPFIDLIFQRTDFYASLLYIQISGIGLGKVVTLFCQ